MLKYRADIDGLRAVAVLSVLIFHFNKKWLPGGFLGVDIFFVISGFLITGIISSQLKAGKFSFSAFYWRRLKRIYPATIFVTIISLLLGKLLMLPADFAALAGSALSTLASAANIYFWLHLDTSYFATSSELTPLLHLWSLGVEEQFYLIWPGILFLSYRSSGVKGVLIASITLTLVSFWLSAAVTISNHSFSYYMLPTRAGELLTGAIAFFLSNRILLHPIAAEALSATGLLTLTLCFWLTGDGENFPGIFSPFVASSVAAIIISGKQTTSLSRLLSTRPLVLIGLISYSLYLWHWPILAFYRYVYGAIEGAAYLACLAAILLGTLISYNLIEKPFRNSASRIRFIISATSALTAISLAAIPILNQSSTTTTDIRAVNEYKFSCQVSIFSNKLINEGRCLVGSKSAPSVLLIGDSNAGHLVGMLDELGTAQNVAIRNITHSGCPPFPDGLSDIYVKPSIAESCRLYNQAIWKEISKYKTVVVAAAWNYYWRLNTQGYISHLDDLVKKLSKNGKRVILVLQVPYFPNYDRNCHQKALLAGDLNCIERGTSSSNKETKINHDLAQFVRRHPNIEILTLRNVLCNSDGCSAYLKGMPLYYDSGHLSMQGSREIGRFLIRTGQAPTL
jgi:peptidoglycan/LPS O-acetylase OafA/YrhL